MYQCYKEKLILYLIKTNSLPKIIYGWKNIKINDNHMIIFIQLILYKKKIKFFIIIFKFGRIK